MIPIKWLPEAQEDLKRLHAFILPHSSKAASRAVNTIVDSVESLIEFPEKGQPLVFDTDFRQLFVEFGAHAYVVRYRFFKKQVIVVRVWHSLERR